MKHVKVGIIQCDRVRTNKSVHRARILNNSRHVAFEWPMNEERIRRIRRFKAIGDEYMDVISNTACIYGGI